MTETAKIAANNSYQKALASAELEHAEATNALLKNYYDQKKAEEQEAYNRTKTEQDEAYNEAMGLIESGKFNTADELGSYINGIKSSVSEDQGKMLDQQLAYYQGSPEQKAAERENVKAVQELAAAEEADKIQVVRKDDVKLGGYLNNTKEGNNFKINGYKVQLGAEADESELPSGKTTGIKDGEVFAYNGALYIKKGGSFYTVKPRGGKLDSDDYQDALALFKEQEKEQEKE